MHEGNAVCVISSRNTIAFTTTTKLDDSTGRTWRCHVYVADLNLPWEVHRVLSHDDGITCLEWDTSGTRLLVADVVGKIQIWVMRDYLLNEWTCFSTSDFPGEHIICAVWFHNGKKIVLSNDKKESIHYGEKFTPGRFGPSVRHIGGRPREGCIAIGATGMICVVLLSMDGEPTLSCESLGLLRSHLKVVDLCYGKNGDFLVAASSGSLYSAVHCFKVTLKVQQCDTRTSLGDGKIAEDKCLISTQALPGFYPTCFNIGSNDRPYNTITHLRWVVREATDAVVVCASGSEGSIIELWELREKQITLNKMFPSANMDNKLKTVNWQHHESQPSSIQVVALTTPRTSIYESSPPPSYILAAYKDKSIKCFYRDALQFVFNIIINPGLFHRADGGMKQLRIGSSIVDMQLTWTGSTLVALDSSSQLYLYRLSPVTDPGGPISANYTVALLEYCLITGIDWWDILLGLRAPLIEQVCDKLTENFNRQSPGLQQYLFSRFITLKMSLYRCLSNGQNKAGDCSALLMLNAIATAFKSMLRPADLSSQDRGPAENLSAILASKNVDNITDIMIHLENKEFIVEPVTLQSMQQLIQWVADYSLYLLASIPQQHQMMAQFPGCGLIHDPKALNTLRELLVIITFWGFIKQSCQPSFTKTSDNLDVIALVFKLLSKALNSYGVEPDDNFLDECCLLPSQVLIPTLNLGVEARGVASPALFLNSLPLLFEFGSVPSFMKYRLENNMVEGSIPTNQLYDNVRHTYLGSHPSQYKQCARCSCMSMLKSLPKSTATKAWDQRWARSCPCGGHWKLATGLN